MTRAAILDEAKAIVTQDRNRQYGEPEDFFAYVAARWSVYLGVGLNRTDVALMMNDLKTARIRANPGHRDSWVDAIGYLACGAEVAGVGE